MKYEFQKINKTRKDTGVALLFTILITSVLLLVSIGISNVSYREIVFSREARDSDLAFFASDSGLECALYLDLLPPAGGTAYTFPHTTPTGTSIPRVFGTTVSCDTITTENVNYIGDGISGGSSDPIYSIINSNGNTCSMVTIEKNAMVGSVSTTLVTSYGYNINHSTGGGFSCLDGTEISSHVVTRALSTQYPNP